MIFCRITRNLFGFTITCDRNRFSKDQVEMKNNIRNFVIVAVLLLNVSCDQITKEVARSNLEYGENISVISGFITLIKVENTGAFLSLGNDLPDILRIILLKILPALFLTGMLVYILRKSNLQLPIAIAFAFIIGGGIGNLYDRILYGSVTDFLHLDFQISQTGIFNLADVSIMIGAFWLMAVSLHSKFSLKKL